MGYRCTQPLQERKANKYAVLVLTAKANYYKNIIAEFPVLWLAALPPRQLARRQPQSQFRRKSQLSNAIPDNSTFPANNRAEVLPAMGWSKKAVRLRVGARSNGCPGETNALTFGEFSRQRSGSRSREGEFALLRLRPGPISNQLKALGISGNTAVQGADTKIRRGKPCL